MLIVHPQGHPNYQNCNKSLSTYFQNFQKHVSMFCIIFLFFVSFEPLFYVWASQIFMLNVSSAIIITSWVYSWSIVFLSLFFLFIYLRSAALEGLVFNHTGKCIFVAFWSMFMFMYRHILRFDMGSTFLCVSDNTEFQSWWTQPLQPQFRKPRL